MEPEHQEGIEPTVQVGTTPPAPLSSPKKSFFTSWSRSLRIRIIAVLLTLIVTIVASVSYVMVQSQKSSNNEAEKVQVISTPTQSISSTVSPTMATPSKSISKSPTVTSTNSGTLPSGNGKISIIYYTGEDKGQGSHEFSPPGATVTLKYHSTGYTKTYTDAPSFFIPNLPKGTYTFTVSNVSQYDVRNQTNVSDYAKNGSVRSEVKPGNTATITLQDGGFASVSFGFTAKSGSTVSNDKTNPQITGVDAPVNFFDANTDHTISQRTFCITLKVKDNASSEANISTQVKLLHLGNSTYVFQSGWVTSKQHCFSNLSNNDYQIEMSVRDEAGNIENYSSNIKILGS